MKEWSNPELKNLNVEQTNEDDICPESNARCLCGYYHWRLSGGCGGCKAPGYICVVTKRKPCLTKRCACGDIPWTPIGPSTPVPKS